MKTKKWITYTIYGMLITAVFLYLRFPSDSVGRYIRSVVAGRNPNVALSFDSARPCFPPGIRLHNLSVGFKSKPGSTLRADVAKMRPALLNLFSGKLGLLFNTDAYEGHIKADIGFTDRFSCKEPLRINIDFDKINIGKCAYIKAASGRKIDGRLRGNMSYNGKWNEFINGAGSARLVLLDGNIQLLGNIFGLNEVNFDKMEADITLKNRSLTITGLDITGKQLSGSFTGNIFLDRDIMQSRLAIKGDIKIPALDRKVSTTLKGTVSKPIPGFR
ncbi:MAG: type II secretion system protein GspN [Thermodesulfobacteriota bacterium]|nr:type II secretion system protein GspN [Thermodesulfobacteriota bacterium]